MRASKKVRRGKETPSPRLSFLTLSFWCHAVLRLAIAGLVVGGGWMGLAMARSNAAALPDFHVSPSSMTFVSKPAWASGAIEQQLRMVPQAESRISLLDRDATKKVAASLAANPWVKEVKSVVRDFPDRIRAKVELREPAAYVLRNNKYYIVDAAGVRLPGEYSRPSEAGLDLLLINIVRSTPPPAGQAWDDPAVVEGAKVAAFLQRYDDLVKGVRITAIDTSNIGGRLTPRASEITLVTADQTRIYWGKGMDTPVARELSPVSKIENLKAVIAQEGNLSSKEYVDLRFANPVFRDRNYFAGSL